jgi:hypothetical protein
MNQVTPDIPVCSPISLYDSDALLDSDGMSETDFPCNPSRKDEVTADDIGHLDPLTEVDDAFSHTQINKNDQILDQKQSIVSIQPNKGPEQTKTPFSDEFMSRFARDRDQQAPPPASFVADNSDYTKQMSSSSLLPCPPLSFDQSISSSHLIESPAAGARLEVPLTFSWKRIVHHFETKFCKTFAKSKKVS